MCWELLQKFRRPNHFLGCPRLLGSCKAAALNMNRYTPIYCDDLYFYFQLVLATTLFHIVVTSQLDIINNYQYYQVVSDVSM